MKRLLLLLVCTLLACGDKPEKGDKGDKGKKADPRPLVEVVTVAPGTVADWLVSSAAVESEAQADLTPATSGIVTAVHAEEGDRVQKGQVLAVIENPNLDATLDRARTQADQAEKAFQEAERLFQEGAVSQRELSDARVALTTARTTLAEAEKTQGFTRLVSPISGTVAVRDLRYGETAAGGRRAFQVVDLDRLRVVVQLPERDLPKVREKQPAVLVPSYNPDAPVPGEVVRLSPVVDAGSGTFRVTVEPREDPPAPSGGSLRPGQFVSVRIEASRHDGVLTLPRRAILYEQGAPHVFRVEEGQPDEEKSEDGESKPPEEPPFWKRWLPGGEEKEEEEVEVPPPYRKAVRVPVELGFQESDLVEVVAGLQEGDVVVTLGQETLKDGTRVRLTGDPTLQDAIDEKKKADEAKGED